MTGADFLWLKTLSELKPCNDSRYSRLGTQKLGQALRRSLLITACLSRGVDVALIVASGNGFEAGNGGDEVEVSCFFGLDITNHNTL